MKSIWKSGAFVALGLCVALALTTLSSVRQTAYGSSSDEGKSAGGPHYTVVMTEAHNLLVTDNATNKVYFYTIDKDKPIGSPLKLRADVDLNKVGADVITITPHNLESPGDK